MKFKKGDIVSFYESWTSYLVLGYKEIWPKESTKRFQIVIKQILPKPQKGSLLGYAEEEDLVLR